MRQPPRSPWKSISSRCANSSMTAGPRSDHPNPKRHVCREYLSDRGPQARECAIVDPGEEAGLILHKVEEIGARPVAIWLTHAHVDHVLGVARVARETGASIWLHPADRPLYDAVPAQVGWFGLAQPEGGPLPAPDAEMVPGQRLRIGQLSLEDRKSVV